MKNKVLITAVSLILVILLVVSVSAAGTVATTEGKSCAKGGTVTINVSITSTSEVVSGAVEVFYDNEILELAETRWYTDGALLSTFDKNTEKGAFAFSSGKNLSGRIFSVTFNVLDNAPMGKTDVECRIQLKTETSDISVTNNKGYVNVTCNHSFTEKSNEHLASEASCTSPATYYYTCSLCGEKARTTYTSGEALPHTFDQKLATADYLVEQVICVDEAEYYYSCKCTAKGSETFTADATWSHNYSATLYIDRDGHWYTCSDCGSIKDYSLHTPENGICSVCKFLIPTDEHIHNHSTVKYNSVGHWNECECGDKKDLFFHSFGDWTVNGDSQSQTCTACGYVNTIPVPDVEEEHTHDHSVIKYDPVGHWNECECGDKKDLAFHTYGDWVIDGENQSQTCTACGYVNTIPVPDVEEEHTHDYSMIKYDSVGHWNECECGDKKDLAFHTYGDWVIDGESQSQTCTACGYVNTIPVSDAEDKEPDQDSPPADGDDSKYSNAILVGILSAVGGIAITLLSVFAIYYIRRKPEAVTESNDYSDNEEITDNNSEE